MINNIPAGNILLSKAILFTGTLPTKALRMLKVYGCASISEITCIFQSSKVLSFSFNFHNLESTSSYSAQKDMPGKEAISAGRRWKG